MTDNRNTILAVILSGLVLIAWQYFFNLPQMEKQRAAQQAQSELAKPAPQAAPGSPAQTGAAPTPLANAPAANETIESVFERSGHRFAQRKRVKKGYSASRKPN